MEKTICRFELSKSGKELNELKHGGSIFLPESDYGFGYITRENADFVFYAIPTYGGEPIREKVFYVGADGARECVKYVQSIC